MTGISYGRLAYEAYREQAGGKSLVTGDALPEWGELPEAIQDAWEAAAQAVQDA